MTFYENLLFLTKLGWVVEIKLDKIMVNVTQIILEMILLVKLLRMMGLNSDSLLGWFTFGSKTEHA